MQLYWGMSIPEIWREANKSTDTMARAAMQKSSSMEILWDPPKEVQQCLIGDLGTSLLAATDVFWSLAHCNQKKIANAFYETFPLAINLFILEQKQGSYFKSRSRSA